MPPAADDEQELLAAIRRGDDAALSALLERYEDRIYRFARSLCRSREDAADVLQETMLAVARHAREFRGDAAFSTWLWTVARRACMKLRRLRAGQPAEFADPGGLPLADPSADPHAAAVRSEARDRILAALDRLSPRHREVILLRDLEGRTAPEVAAILGLDVGAVKSRLHRARAKLRRILLDDAQLPPPPASDPTACFEVEEALSKMIEGDLPAEACNRLSRHVDACPRCKARCDGLGTILAACRNLPPESPPPEVRRLVRRAVRKALSGGGAPA